MICVCSLVGRHDRFINVRKLAALDIVFHGYRLILIEFGLGTFLLALFGIWLTGRSLLLGSYLMLLGLNYVPLFVYAIAITRKNSTKGGCNRVIEERYETQVWSPTSAPNDSARNSHPSSHTGNQDSNRVRRPIICLVCVRTSIPTHTMISSR